ncbi:MAG TPA: T9SS type A sorting domain-containing protein [Bacteroidia bacterium]|nr:T9SS type A sorting domain-containing protein [Bacteroidia bacterium]
MIRNSTRRMRLVQRPRLRLTLHKRVYVATSFLSVLALAFVVFINLYDARQAFGAASGDYRTAATGNWNNILTWETYNGSIWVAAVATPSSADGVITIQSGHTVSVTANVTVDQVVVASGGTLTNSAATLTVANGTGSDIEISGTVNLNTGGTVTINSSAVISILSGGIYNYNGGSETTGAGWAVNNGGTYVHGVNGVEIPSGTWGSTSTLKITGVTSMDPDNCNQALGNVIYDCPSQTANLDFKDKLTIINGDFTVVNTGSGSIKFDKSSTNVTLNVAGNYYQTGGTLKMTNMGNWNVSVAGNFSLSGGTFIMAGSDGVPALTVGGNISISGGTLDMSQYTGNTASKGIGTINLSGNFTQTGGSVTETATQIGRGDIFFAKTGTQTFSITGGSITNTINFTVNSTTILDAGNNIFTGDGTFTLVSGGGIILGNSGGISSSGATGNIQVTGTRTFSTGGNYTYSGTTAQVTGTGLPSQVNNLTFNNSSGFTLTNSVIVASTLTFTSGNLTTVSDTITLGTAQSNTGTLSRTSGHVIGHIKRWFSSSTVSNILFPVGTSSYYEGANVSITSVPSGGTVTANFLDSMNSYYGLQIPDDGVMIGTIGRGYWEFSPGNSMSGGAYTLDLYANSLAPLMTDYTKMHVIRKAILADPWGVSGTHAAGTGSNAAPVAHRTSVTVWGIFAIGSAVGYPLPIELVYFDAKPSDNVVKCSWQTASEINNDYFTVERSSDGKDFIAVENINGAGNSSSTKTYSFSDENVSTGIFYYRLRQTDFDGTSTCSKAITVVMNESGEVSQVSIDKVYPNPFSESFAVSFNSPAREDVEITIMDVSGKIMSRDAMACEKGINRYGFRNPGTMANGYYYIRISSARKSAMQKIVKL